MSLDESISILVVDDDPMMRVLVKGHLDDEHYRIDEAVDGLDGLKKMAEKDYDLAIVDLYMPGMNGEQLLKEIRKTNKFVGLVVLTSENKVEVSYRLLEQYDISDYVVKPMFSEMQLKFSVKNALGRRHFLLQQDKYITSLEHLRHQAEEAKSHFLTQMSHELNTPMNVILGFGQLLESMDDGFNEKQKSYIKHIVKAGWTLMEMIEKILRLSSCEFDVLNIQQTPLNVDNIIEDVVRHFLPEARKRNIEMKHKHSHLRVMADHVQLRTVIFSVVSNAIIYNKDGGEVLISSQLTERNTVRVSVKDTGIGISDDKLKDLYTPFDRLGAELKAVSGAGVSLTLARRLVEAMDGSIDYESIKDVGSTFYIELQQAPPQ